MIRIIVILFLLSSVPSSSLAFAEHIFNPGAYAEYLDISQLEAEKFVFEFNGTSYSIYYGYHGSLDDTKTDSLRDPTVKEMIINQERKSIEVTFEEVPKTTDFWVRIPFDILTADKEQYQLLIDGEDAGSDIMKMPDGYVVGMIITEDTKHVEIIGTKVIPEFGGFAILILGLSVLALILFARKSAIPSTWSRIN